MHIVPNDLLVQLHTRNKGESEEKKNLKGEKVRKLRKKRKKKLGDRKEMRDRN